MEPPRKGHFGEMAYVPCREVVPISEVCLFFHCIILIQVCFQYIMNYLQSGLVMITVSSDSIYSTVNTTPWHVAPLDSIVTRCEQVQPNKVNQGGYGLEVPCV